MKIEDLLFSLPLPVALTDGEGRISYVNQKMESFLNRSLKYLKDRKLSEFFKNKKDIEEQIKKSYTELLEIFGFKDNGHYLTFAPLYISSKVEGVIVIVQQDTSPFEKDITLFLKGISHEIRNPLGGIKGAAKLLSTLKSYDKELVSVILEETERIERFLDNIVKAFDFSKLSFSRRNIHEIIQSVVKLFEHEIKRHKVKVVYNFDPSLPEILLDSDKITQAIINIFKNALESLTDAKDKLIRIETGYAIQPSGFIFIRIADTGCGMDEEELKNFFLPFFTTKEKGTGLGTFIANEIVKGHGGELKVKSEKNVGTEITIFLPMRRNDGKDFNSR
ncbi:MAG: ATP-binding protein [Desulfurobacteriaceae bacterium]